MTTKPSRQIAYPFHIGPHGGIAYTEDPQRQAMQSIVATLITQPGERVMVPQFGTPTAEFLYENLDESFASEAVVLIQQALARWESTAIIHEVIPSFEEAAEGALTLTISFSVPPNAEVLTTVVDVGGALTGGTGV